MDADRVGARVVQRAAIDGQVARRLALHLDRQVGHAPPDRRDARARGAWRRGRGRWTCRWSSPSGVMPSSATAASATSASCAGRLHRGRRARAQRLLDRAEAAARRPRRVADAGLHDRGGEHVAAVQPGDLLVRRRRRRWPGRRSAGRATARRRVPVSTPVARQPAARATAIGTCGSLSGTASPTPSSSTCPSSLGPAPARRRTGASSSADAAGSATSTRVRSWPAGHGGHLRGCRWS